MCEIAVIDPEQCDVSIIQQLAGQFYREQGDGLGVLAVKSKVDSFEYDHYKSTKPHWQTLYAFLRRNAGDTWRFVLHGRNGTAGGVNRESAHPIKIDCSRCDFDWVIHNGSVRSHKNIRGGLTSQGHSFNTKVDSEVIPHKVRELPDSVNGFGYNTYDIRGNLNYLLFCEDGILVKSLQKYHLTEEFTMTCSYRDIENPEEHGFGRGRWNKWMLIEPGEEPDIEIERGSVTSTVSSSTGWSSQQARAAPSYNYQNDDEDSTYTVTYQDLTPELSEIVAIEVAPNIIRVIDKNTDENDYVHRLYEPRLYYYYSDQEAPDNLDELEKRAEAREQALQNATQSDSETEFMDDEMIEGISATAAITVAHHVSDMNIEEAQAVQEEVEESIRSNRNIMEGTIA